MRTAIEDQLGADAMSRFEEKRERIEEKYQAKLERYDLLSKITEAIDDIDQNDDDDDDDE